MRMSYILEISDQPPQVKAAIKIFGNTLRVGIIRQLYLGKTGRAEIAEALGVSDLALTRPISSLIDHGLVHGKPIRGVPGRPMEYTLDVDATNELFAALQDYYRGRTSLLPPIPEEEEPQ